MLKSSSMDGIRPEETTLISRGVQIEGKVSSDGNIIVDGRVKGDILCQKNVSIGEGGQVNGHISANIIIIGGNVVGTVTAKEKLALEPKGNLKGDISAKILVVEAGAKFNGNIKMGDTQNIPEIKEISSTESPLILESKRS
jgi:cytoskeletal protein CcmA (bactofilin family)